MTYYGRIDSDWDELRRVGRAFLEERARLEMDTTYTEMNAVLEHRTGLRAFDFDREDERAAMGHLLGLIVDETFSSIRCLLSALVHYLNENHAGPGFFELAAKRGLLPAGASDDDKLVFWADQVAAVFAAYRRPRRIRRRD
jgi:hypothetical protein